LNFIGKCCVERAASTSTGQGTQYHTLIKGSTVYSVLNKGEVVMALFAKLMYEVKSLV
jgi:hypothetical protein